MGKISVSVGICAYNEERDIGRLLERLLNQKTDIVDIREIIVVSSGSTDRTDEIVKAFSKRDSRVKLVTQPRRMGKASAVNEFLKRASGDVCVLESADTIPAQDAVEKLCRPFLDPRVGMTGGRPIPLNDEGTFIGFVGRLLWWLHHRISVRNPKLGELIAFRRVISSIPEDVVVDECYIEAVIKGTLDLGRIRHDEGGPSGHSPEAQQAPLVPRSHRPRASSQNSRRLRLLQRQEAPRMGGGPVHEGPRRRSPRGGGLKAALVCPRFHPTPGGAERYTYNLALRLPSLGWEVAVLTSDGHYRGRNPVRIKGFTVHYVPPMHLLEYTLPRPSSLRILRALNPHIVHVSGPHPYSDAFALAAKALGIPRVMTHHAPLKPKSVVKQLLARVERAAFKWLYDWVIVTSALNRRRLESAFPAGRIRVIPAD